MHYSLKIIFSNDSHIIIDEKTTIRGIRTLEFNHEPRNNLEKQDRFLYPKSATEVEDPDLILSVHHNHGLIPSAMDLFVNYKYFSIDQNHEKYYAVNAIVNIEQIIK